MQVRYLLKFVRKHLDAGNRDQVYFAIDGALATRKIFPDMIFGPRTAAPDKPRQQSLP